MKHRAKGYTFVEIMVVVGVMGLLVAIAAFNYMIARKNAQGDLCSSNLYKIHAAKQQWGFENNAADTAEPEMEEILPYLSVQEDKEITCPSGGTYTMMPLKSPPVCSLGDSVGRHKLVR